MIYYRVRVKYDNVCKNPKVHDDNIFVGGELYTVFEAAKLRNNYHEVFKKYPDLLEYVQVDKDKTHMFMGARFSDEECFGGND